MATLVKTSNLADAAVTGAKLHTTMDLTGKTVTIAAPSGNTHPATKLYVDTEIANLIDSAPATLNTLNELAAAINDDANYQATIATSLASKLPLTGGTLTGDLTIPNKLIHAGDTDTYLQFAPNGNVSLYADGYQLMNGTSTSVTFLRDIVGFQKITTDGIGQFNDYIDLNTVGNRGKVGYDSNNVYIGSTASAGQIIFKNGITATDAPQTSGTVRMTIDASGNVGVGATSPATSYGKVLHIHDTGTSGANLRLTDANSGAGTGNGLDIIQLGVDSYFINREAGDVNFYTNGQARFTIHADGHLGFGDSILNDSPWSNVFGARSQWDTMGVIAATDGSMQIGHNWYYDAANTTGYKYITSGKANRQIHVNDYISWEMTDTTGSAGGEITFKETMKLKPADAYGTLLIRPQSADTTNAVIRLGNNLNANPYIFFNTDGNDWAMGSQRNDGNKFKISDYSSLGTNDRMVIDTSGIFMVNKSTADGGTTGFEVRGDGSHWMTKNAATNTAVLTIYQTTGGGNNDVDSGLVIKGHGTNLASGKSSLLRVEGLNTTWGTVDAFTVTNNGLTGIGTYQPTDKLVVISGGSGGILIAKNYSGTPSSGDTLGAVGFKGYSQGNSVAGADTRIQGVADGAHSGSSAPARLEFYVKHPTTGPGSAPTRRMQLSSYGELLLEAGARGWSSFYMNSNAGIRYHVKRFYAGSSVVTNSFLRVKRHYWGVGFYKIWLKQQYYYTTPEAWWNLSGYGRADGSYNPNYALNYNDEYGGMGSGRLQLTTPSTSSPGSTAAAYVDVQIVCPAYHHYILVIEAGGMASYSHDPSSMSGNDMYALH